MIQRIYGIAVIVLFVGLGAGTTLAQNTSGDAAIKKLVSDYDAAWNSKNVKAVDEMLDDKYTYFSSVGTLSSKKPTLEFLGKPDYKLTFVNRSEVEVRSSGGNIAVVSSRWQGKGSWSGGEINDDQRCGQVWAKEKGKWRMLSEHCVQITAK
jgi:Ketosteroid isomerase homolog